MYRNWASQNPLSAAPEAEPNKINTTVKVRAAYTCAEMHREAGVDRKALTGRKIEILPLPWEVLTWAVGGGVR